MTWKTTAKGPMVRQRVRPAGERPDQVRLSVALVAGAVVVLALAVVALTLMRSRGSTAPPADDDTTQMMAAQEREIESLRRRVATLSARLAQAGVCTDMPVLFARAQETPSEGVLATAPEGQGGGGSDAARPDGGAKGGVAEGGETAVAASDGSVPAALSTTWGTESFLRELARSSAASLSIEQAVCSDDVCRLAISGRGAPEEDALALQRFVGRSAEWLSKTQIQPGTAGSPTVVLLARPGHELPAPVPTAEPAPD